MWTTDPRCGAAHGGGLKRGEISRRWFLPTKVRQKTTTRLGWAPSIPLRAGMEQTYCWIYDQAKAREGGRPYVDGLSALIRPLS